MSDSRWDRQLDFNFELTGGALEPGADHWGEENTLRAHEWETDDEGIYDEWPEYE